MDDHTDEAEQGRVTPPTQDGVVTKTMAETSARSSPVPSETNSRWLSGWVKEQQPPLGIQPPLLSLSLFSKWQKFSKLI